ncbi:MAG: PTS glucose transporter subunit IIA [Epsilonproteobacteria bacterium]|nr:MAG: PTS glucose transporter subunit IIA [Campylobacterota bacterium]
MFGFLNRKMRKIYAPVDGEVLSIESVKDEVFSQKLVGDGVAIMPMSNIFKAPIDGVISKIFSTNHAYSIKSPKDLEVMVHIGLDTVALEGKGFERLLEEGAEVKVGDGIIKADLAYIKEQAKDIITPILILEESDVKDIKKYLKIVKNKDIIMEVN